MISGALRIAVLYSLFASVATLANIGCQALVIWLYRGPLCIELSIALGTVAGLPIKYVLEKRHIFYFESDGFSHDSKLFVLYSSLGIITTALFWSVEYTFHYVFGTDTMRYVGAVLGLAMGYIIKYFLDKRFVFVTRTPASAGIT